MLRPAPGRVPPHDLDAEAAILSAILLQADRYDDVAPLLLGGAALYSDQNRHIYEAIVTLRESGRPVDSVTVTIELRATEKLGRAGGTPYIGMLINEIPHVANVIAYAEVVRDRYTKRQLISRAQTIAAETYTSEEPATTLVLAGEAALSELALSGMKTPLVRAGPVFDSEIERLKIASELGLTFTGIDTGFSGINRKTAGLHKGDLTVVAGRPGIGKTAFVLNVCANVARAKESVPGYGVAFFSLEMPKEQLALRLACAEQNIDFTSLRTGHIPPTTWNALTDAAQGLKSMPIWIDDTPAITIQLLRARARQLQRNIERQRTDVESKELGLVVIDYMQLAQGVRGKNDNRESEVASISRDLKNVAKELGVPVIALSQLNRSVEKRSGDHKRPELSDLRESGAIEQDADNIWFLYRGDYYDNQAPQGEAECGIAKQRNGATGPVPLFFRKPSMRFYDRVGPGTEDEEFADDFQGGM